MRILEIQRPGRDPERVVTYLEEDEMRRLGGVPPEGVVGLLEEDGTFRANARFREFLHRTIGLRAPLDPNLQEAARGQGTGRLVYIDDRAPESELPVEPEDILGWFQIENGAIVEDSYLPNPTHRIEGRHGITAAAEVFARYMAADLIENQPPPSGPGAES